MVQPTSDLSELAMGCSLPILVVLVGVLQMRQGIWLLPAAQWTPTT